MTSYNLTLIFSIFLWAIQVTAQPAGNILTSQTKQIITEKIGRLLEVNYIDKEVGKTCADYLSKQQENGHYEQISHPREFAKQLNEELFKINNDRHIRVQFIPPEGRDIELQNPDLFFLLRTYERKKENYGFREVKIFAGNIGYLDLRLFEPIELVREKALQAMHFLEDADALIIDLRKNSGGNPATVQFLCSWFFDQPVHLNTIHWRRGDYNEEFWTLDSIGLPKKPELPLLILTSSKTFSAAEEFAYTMQVQRRATLLGEITAGGANPGYRFSINDQFSIFIPTGRSTNPVTGTNWEGVGVKPDIAVSQANVLDIALERALLTGRLYREKQDDQRVGNFMELSNKLKEISASIKKSQSADSVSDLETILDYQMRKGMINEWVVNNLAYRYMSDNNPQLALVLFKYNTTRFPSSANAWDSLGEVYDELGQWESGIEAYQKALLLDPGSQNAQMMLDKLKGKTGESKGNRQDLK
jgi:tetratricopeptide (TPR) repeat protein